MSTNERQYIPQVGDGVRLKTFSDYAKYGLLAWSTLHVTPVSFHDSYINCVRSLTRNAENDGDLVNIALADIETPIGWKPRYTITVAPEQLDTVLSWFRDARGIAVLQSHYMPSCPTAFAPADNQSADWRFNGADKEVIQAQDCARLFCVVKIEHSTPAISVTCEYCNGTGAIANAQYTGPCNCEDGRRPRYFSELDAKQRKQATAELESLGWKIWYQKQGREWRMERETVIKDFGSEVSA